jgi:hypothetical protein
MSMVNEVSGEAKEITKLVKVNVIYTDTDEKLKKSKYLLINGSFYFK